MKVSETKASQYFAKRNVTSSISMKFDIRRIKVDNYLFEMYISRKYIVWIEQKQLRLFVFTIFS